MTDGAPSTARDGTRPRQQADAPRLATQQLIDGPKSAVSIRQEPGDHASDHYEERNGVDGSEPISGDPVAELDLLRDLPFTLQGISSNSFKFDSASTLSLPRNLSLPMISLLHTLAEPSLLYRNLSEFTQSPHSGLVSQSLRAAIGIELRSYLGLIATLEGETRRTITAASKDRNHARNAGVTLKRCVVWTRDATLGLRLMSSMAEESRSRLILR